MKHLSPETLGTLLDGALNDAQRADAERHLEGCAECQRALAALLAQDALTLQALEHDPGEAYFESFASRVSERIGAEDAAAVNPRRVAPGWWAALWTPRGLAFAGSVAALLVVGILALEQSQSRRNVLTNPQLAERDAQQEAAPTTPQQGPELATVPQAANGGATAPFAAAPSAGTESKKSAPRASTLAEAPEQVAQQAPSRDERGDATGAVRKEFAAAPTAQQSVIPNGAGEERPSGSRKVQDVASKDALALQDAAPAPLAAGKPADAVGAVRSELLRSLKGRRAAPLEPQAQETGATHSTKALAAPPSLSGGRTSMDKAATGVAWAPASRPLVASAESLSVIASAGNLAAAHDVAAVAWERVREVQAANSPGRFEAQARIAGARYAAWMVAATPVRSATARDALSGVMGMLPQGPRRQHFEAMLLRVREGVDHP